MEASRGCTRETGDREAACALFFSRGSHKRLREGNEGETGLSVDHNTSPPGEPLIVFFVEWKGAQRDSRTEDRCFWRRGCKGDSGNFFPSKTLTTCVRGGALERSQRRVFQVLPERIHDRGGALARSRQSWRDASRADKKETRRVRVWRRPLKNTQEPKVRAR